MLSGCSVKGRWWNIFFPQNLLHVSATTLTATTLTVKINPLLYSPFSHWSSLSFMGPNSHAMNMNNNNKNVLRCPRENTDHTSEWQPYKDEYILELHLNIPSFSSHSFTLLYTRIIVHQLYSWFKIYIYRDIGIYIYIYTHTHTHTEIESTWYGIGTAVGT